MYYKSSYIQKGYGLGGVFRNLAKFIRPVARNVVKMVNKPAVKRVLKSVGKEALDTSTELLLNSLKSNAENSGLHEKISKAKACIDKSIENAKHVKAKRKGYHKLREDSDEDEQMFYANPTHFPHKSNLHMQSRSLLKHISSKKKKQNKNKKTNNVTRRSRNKYTKTIFD